MFNNKSHLEAVFYDLFRTFGHENQLFSSPIEVFVILHNIEVLHNIVIKHNIKDMITKSTLERIIGDDLSEIWKALTSDEKRVKVTDNFKYERYKKNQMIYAESETPENLYCLLEEKSNSSRAASATGHRF